MDLFNTKVTAATGTAPSETSSGSAAAQASEGGRPARRAAAAKGQRSAGSADTEVLHVRMRKPVIAAIDEAVKQSPIEFANASDFVRCAVEAQLRLRGLVKTYK